MGTCFSAGDVSSGLLIFSAMQQEDDLKALENIVQFARGLGVFFLVLHVYWYCYEWLSSCGLTYGYADRLLLDIQRTTLLFSSPVITKLCAFLFLALGCYGTKSVRNGRVDRRHIVAAACLGFPLFFLNGFLLSLPAGIGFRGWSYTLTLGAGYLSLLAAGVWLRRLMKQPLMDDPFNDNNESFLQEERCIDNDCSVNLPTRYRYKGQWRNGWISVVNVYRSTAVIGLPGSGKSYAVLNNYIKQHIEKGFSMLIYDYKFDDLTRIAYNHLLRHLDKYTVKPRFCIINFDDPRRSNRCNPIDARFMDDISDAYESAYVTLLNLNKTWVDKQGDFFTDSAVILLAAIIWYLKIYDNGHYCTFPHAIEFLNKRYEDIFPILTSYPELENYLSPFMDAWLGGAQDQLQGQIASAKIPLSRMISPQLYWVMSGDDFTLDINNPDDPKILCVGNNPDRQNIYGAALGLYNSRIVKLINKKGQLKSGIIIDELPTIYFKGLDNLIATARSNKVAVLLCFQDFSQLKRDYGDKEAAVVMNTVGNIFSGQVVGETAKTLSERFGKVLQKRQSMTLSRSDKSTSISTQLDSLIPASKISTLTQGMFVGAVADNFDERIEQKIFHCEIVVDNEKVKAETARYKKIPQITDFTDENGTDHMKQVVQENYERIKAEAGRIVAEELERIKNDPVLCKLLPEQN